MFLGTTAVAPRSDVKRHFEDIFTGQTRDLGAELNTSLARLFTLPQLADREDPRATDLVLDVVITHHQAGGIEVIQFEWWPIPFGWRPKLTVTGRVSNVDTNRPINTYVINQKQPWADFLTDQVEPYHDLKSIFFQPPFDSEVLNQLLYRGCTKLLTRVTKDIK